MSFRQVYIKNAEKLSYESNSLFIKRVDKENIKIPLEDISNIFIEDPHTVLTARLLSEASKNSISIITCDEKYFPICQSIPLNTAYCEAATQYMQLEQKDRFKGYIWKKIIIQKIQNQHDVLSLCREEEQTLIALDYNLKSVLLNDSDHRESVSARIYFKAMFGEEFQRFASGAISEALNYGYTILLGEITRKIASKGLNNILGVWHHGPKNAYNLACDLIEPFRPLIDYYVYWNIEKIDYPLSIGVRKDLVNILNSKVRIDGKETLVTNAINLVVDSYVQSLKDMDYNKLSLPSILEIKYV